MRKYLHDYDGMLEQEIARVKSAQISAKNRSLILKFYEYNLCRNISKARMIRHCTSLRLIAKRLKKDLNKLQRKDIEKLFLLMMKEKKSVASIETDKEILKCFFKWLNNGKQPACVKWFSCRGSKTEKKLPEDMLEQEDIKRLLKAALNKRDKAMIAVLWESGARVGEIGGLQIKNLAFDKFGCKIIVDGKTGIRPVRLVNSAPDLLEWINAHPNSSDQQAPVWVRKEQNVGEQLTHRYIMKMLKQTAKRAKINKPVNPHHFRHSRATYMAQHLTEAQMKEYFGWVQDSKMAARYVHLSGKQVDNAILRLHGLVNEDKAEDILKREPCPRCKEQNDVNNQYCQKCWLPLTQEAAQEVQEIEQKDQEAIIAVMELMQFAKGNPAVVKQVLTSLHGQ
ncbi:MAG: tyrosine-type recombinase/integrase [Candidatus Diapherotrites archaeon]